MKKSLSISALFAGAMVLLTMSSTMAKDSFLIVSVDNKKATVLGRSCSIKDKKALEKLITEAGKSPGTLLKIKPSKSALYTSIVSVMEAAYKSGVRKMHVMQAPGENNK